MSGNLGVLGNLFTAALGGYDPKPTVDPDNKTMWPSLATWICVFFVFATFYLGLYNPKFSPDSWSYLELSDSVFTDFYRVSTVRQFESTSAYSTAFPPLWPVCLAVFGKILGLGIYTGCLLNFVICLAILPVVLRLSRQLRMPSWAGHAIFLLLLALPYFRSELLAARSIPLSILLIGCLISLLMRPGAINPMRAAAMGLLAGLACLNRFDFLLAGLGLGVLMMILNAASATQNEATTRPDRSKNLTTAAVFYTLFFATLSPWFHYCYTHFGTPMASDNARQVYGATLSHVCNFYSSDRTLATLWNSPGSWITGLFTTKLVSISKMGMILIAAVPVMAIIKVRRGFTGDSDRRLWFLAVLIGALAAVPIVLTGYGDGRYFCLHFLLTSLMGATLVLADQTPKAWILKLRYAPAAVAIVLILLQSKSGLLSLHSIPKVDVQTAATSKFAEIASAIRSDGNDEASQPRVLIASGAEACQFGAVTKVGAVLKPFNFESEIVDEFVSRFGITHVLDPEGSVLSDFASRYTLESVGPVGLYQLHLQQQAKNRIGQASSPARGEEF